jgi:hypothetical protein
LVDGDVARVGLSVGVLLALVVDAPCTGLLGVVPDGEDAARAGSAPSSFAMIVAMRAVRQECSATDSGCCTPAIHQPVRAVFFSVPASYRKRATAVRSSDTVGLLSRLGEEDRVPDAFQLPSPARREPTAIQLYGEPVA